MITDEKPFKALHATLEWLPYVHVGDGYKSVGYQRADHAGYVLPDQKSGYWWVTWRHPFTGRPGWHHHALGRYDSAMSGAMAFDKIYDLELITGNIDRMTCADGGKL